MKKVIYIGCGIALIVGIVFVGVKVETPLAHAQPASGQNYYDYHSLNTADARAGVAVWATSTDERFAIHTLTINGPVAMEVQLLDGAVEIQTYYYAADGGACPIYNLRSVAPGNDLSIKSNAAGQISICVVGDSLWF